MPTPPSDDTLKKMVRNALDATCLPPLPKPQPGAVRLVLVAEVFPDKGNALVASAFTPVLTAPAQDWLKAAAAKLEEGIAQYIHGFRYDKTWHDLHGEEAKK